MCRFARNSCLVGAVALLLAACGLETDENRGPLDIPRGLGKADNAFSCKGHCGGKAPGCYCDDKCADYGDCCPDKAKVCDASDAGPGPGSDAGTFCGGIAGIQCPSGQKCKLDGSYPDAGGTCVPQSYCETTADCAGLIHPACMGQWQCTSNTCSWKCGVLPPPPPPCGQLQQQACENRTDCEWKTTPGFPGPISMCVKKTQGKKCGPFLGGQCGSGEVCNIKSCALGATGTCETQPKQSQCFDYFWQQAAPVCGCDGKTYANDCLRLVAGAPMKHSGACQTNPSNKCFTDADCQSGEFCALTPGECLLPTFNILQGTCKKMPQVCYEIYAPVCGCDGKTYSNDCHAAGAGVNVAKKGACKPKPTSYCQGFCGGKSPHNCYCDAQCSKYGDCCPDVKQSCPNL